MQSRNTESKGEPAMAPRGSMTRGVLRDHHTLIVSELHAAIASGSAPGQALSVVFRLHFGLDRAPVEWLIFAHYGAGLSREIWLRHIGENPNEAEQTRRAALDLKRQFSILRHIDREALKVFDMRYVAGCSNRSIAGLKRNAMEGSFAEWVAVLSPASLALYEEPTAGQVRDVGKTLRFWMHVYRATSMGNAARELTRLVRRLERSM